MPTERDPTGAARPSTSETSPTIRQSARRQSDSESSPTIRQRAAHRADSESSRTIREGLERGRAGGNRHGRFRTGALRGFGPGAPPGRTATGRVTPLEFTSTAWTSTNLLSAASGPAPGAPATSPSFAGRGGRGCTATTPAGSGPTSIATASPTSDRLGCSRDRRRRSTSTTGGGRSGRAMPPGTSAAGSGCSAARRMPCAPACGRRGAGGRRCAGCSPHRSAARSRSWTALRASRAHSSPTATHCASRSIRRTSWPACGRSSTRPPSAG